MPCHCDPAAPHVCDRDRDGYRNGRADRLLNQRLDVAWNSASIAYRRGYRRGWLSADSGKARGDDR